MSLIATLFTNSCADGALVPAGGVWARATEANRQQPTVISSDLFMICTPGVVRLARRATHQSGRALLVPRHGAGERDRTVKSSIRPNDPPTMLRCNQELSTDRFRGRSSARGVEGRGPSPRRLTRRCPAEAGHWWAIRRLRPAG